MRNLSLASAQQLISEKAHVTGVEHVGLTDGLGRVIAEAHYARLSSPPYAHSLYDGFAISRKHFARHGNELIYRLGGEIAAGDRVELRSKVGEAYRVMTGARVPKNSWKVVPQEKCTCDTREIRIVEDEVVKAEKNIRKKGGDIRKGSMIVRPGIRLTPQLLTNLCEGGIETLAVRQRPKVALFCTGSELADEPVDMAGNTKVSSNRVLLDSLIQSYGGEVDYFGTVTDDLQQIRALVLKIADSTPDIIISTGGMGPGKYDLVERVFAAAGGIIHFNTLALRPGKATLFGSIGSSLYFGLPGPPYGVKSLFHVLVRPLLLKSLGFTHWRKQMLTARLQSPLRKGGDGVMVLKEGVLSSSEGKMTVSVCSPRHPANCYIICPYGAKVLRKNQKVKIIPFSHHYYHQIC